MKYQYIRSFIVLVAGLVTIIMNIKTNKSVTLSLLILLLVLIVFYVIGTLAIEILQHFIEKKVPESEVTVIEEDEEEDEEPAKAVETYEDDDEE